LFISTPENIKRGIELLKKEEATKAKAAPKKRVEKEAQA
jgi:hypothetical protein